jgi:tRNA uridine 5-carboxymethylaminomethyl modification enzyme
MGQAIDATGIQFRLLNRRKGPAMHSPRAQADKKAYQQEVKRIVEEAGEPDLRQEVSRTCSSKSAAADAWGVAFGATRSTAPRRWSSPRAPSCRR